MNLDRPILIYDGACAFCRRWIDRWRRWTGERVNYRPSQEVAAAFPAIPAERFRESVVLIEPDGRVSYGAEAVARSLAVRTWGRPLLWTYRSVPGAATAAESLYRWVARRRGRWPVR